MADRDFVGLVGDIGGTNARFALAHVEGGSVRLDQVQSLPGHDYPGVEAAAAAYLARVGRPAIAAAAAACAGPIVDGAVAFTNVAWATCERAFGAALGLGRVQLLNDLEAVAWAAPALPAAGLRRLGPAEASAAGGPATLAILNAGTGCNASAFVANASGRAVVVGEYGHAGFAPRDEIELAIWRHLLGVYGRVSIERVLCGPGLVNLYRALAGIEGLAAEHDTPEAVAAATDGLAGRAVERFCAIMGSVAGDVALCFGARAGVYLAGGVAARLMTEGRDAAFRARFEDKGRFGGYLAAVPTWLIRDGNVALLGAARAMAALGHER